MIITRNMIDSAGSFLLSELERLDPTIYRPLVSITWGRDINVRTDVTMADELSSFTQTSYSHVGHAGQGINWASKINNTPKGGALDIGKTATPLGQVEYEVGWNIVELLTSQQLGRPIDVEYLEQEMMKYQMDTDKMVYVGDDSITYQGAALTGLLNSDSKVATVTNVVNTGNWLAGGLTPSQILQNIQEAERAVWAATGYTMSPYKIVLPPEHFAYLNSQVVSQAGMESILSYVKRNSLCMANNGVPLTIVPSKWLSTFGSVGDRRMVVYTNEKQFVRFPLVPLQRTPLESRGTMQLTTYYGKLGAVEFPRAETVGYFDGI